MRLLFGVKSAAQPATDTIIEWGKEVPIRSFLLSDCKLDTIPFRFRISHKESGRFLAVAHPRNQILMAEFYRDHAALICYHCSKSRFSIRHPVHAASHSYHKDKMHRELLADARGGVEEAGLEYEQLGSYFAYRKYSNIHKFFESYQYHRSEKKYDHMAQLDISRCFESIYTHSVVWAVLGKQQTKFSLSSSKNTFPGLFDQQMQWLNQKETNGIIIGPEFSRVFAELILQSADVMIEQLLGQAGLQHRKDYEIFRYVDDYFVFYNQPSTGLKAAEIIDVSLNELKMGINPAKTRVHEKPIVTEITAAKDLLSGLLNEFISLPEQSPGSTDDPPSKNVVVFGFNTNRAIIKFKTKMKQSAVSYADILNYALAIIEKKIDQVLVAHAKHLNDPQNHGKLADDLLVILEFLFFIYAGHPRVNHTIRVVRAVVGILDFLDFHAFDFEAKHLVAKYVHDNFAQQLTKNKSQRYREVESLYLLIGLSRLGREYWLSEAALADYFSVSTDTQGKYAPASPDSPAQHLNYFSITVAFNYMRDKKRYNGLRAFFEGQVVEKVKHMQAHCPNDAELLMLFLDTITCPYVSQPTKDKLADLFGLQPAEFAQVGGASDQWFTTWNNLDLGAELDAKRSREVY